MFDFSFWEILVVAVVVLLVVGPQRLPTVARTIGRYVAKLRSLSSHLKDEFEQQAKMDELNANRKRAEQAERQQQEDHRA